jgi:PAS domain S-box-containing protein
MSSRAPAGDRLAAIVDGTDDAILGKDRDGIITDWNPAAERLYGYTAEQAVGRHVGMLVPADRAGEDERILALVLSDEKVERYETERLRADGTRVPVSLTVSPIRGADGTPVGASTIARDVSERRAVEAARDRLAALVEHTGDAIYARDAHGILTDWNAGAERLYGWRADEVVGRSAHDIVPPEHRSQLEEVLGRVLDGAVVSARETVRLRKDGTRVHVSLSFSPILDHAGAVTGVTTIARDLTRRVRAEQALIRSEARFRALVEAAPDPILGVRADGRIAFASSRIAGLLGYEPHELVGRPIEALLVERHGTGLLGPPAASAEHPPGRPLGADRELFARRKDGSDVPVEISLGHTGDGADGVTTAVLVDVTGRRRADEDRALLASLVEGSGDAIVSVSRQGCVLTWNPAAERMLRLPAEQAIGRHMDDVVSAMDNAELRRGMVARVFDESATLHYQAVRRSLAGEEIAIDVTVSPVLGPGGTPVAACVICRDMTAQLAAETQTRRLAAIIESSQDPAITLSLDDVVMSWNPAAERMYGITAGEAIGRAVEDLIPDPSGDRRELRARIGRGEAIVDHEAVRRVPDGRELRISITGFPVRGDDGAVMALAFIVHDVTEQQRIAEQLRQTQRIEAVGRLAGGVAHDFNNLLTVITGYGAIAQRHVGDGRGAEELREVQRAALRASELTGHLLDFSRQRTIEAVPLDLSRTVRGLMPMLERLIGEDIHVVSLVEDDVPPVLADRGQIEQVIVNLVVNARDAMPGGGTLTIETRAVSLPPDRAEDPSGAPPGRHVCLTVTDTGAGIDPAIAAHLFEPFFTTKELGKGTGLGLATVDGIVGQAGGQVRVYSEPGMGASFKVYLPVADVRDATAARPPEPVPERVGGHETVLLVEDEEALRGLIERVLSRAGYAVLTAERPETALGLVAGGRRPIDVLVTDVIMPGMTGPELAARLTGDFGPIRTLFLSGYTADVLHDRGRLPAGSAFLEKPFDPAGLLAAVRTLLDAPAVASTAEPGCGQAAAS